MVLKGRRKSRILIAILSIALFGCENPLAKVAETIKAAATTPILVLKDAAGAVLPAGSTIDLGILGVESSVEYEATILNTGKTPLVFTDTQLDFADGTESDSFTILSTPENVDAGGASYVRIGFARKSPGTKQATLTLKTNDYNQPAFTISLSGIALDPSAAVISSFSIRNPTSAGIISGNAITVFVPWNTTNYAMWVADFVTTGGSVTVDGVVQTSGSSNVDFPSPVTYRVTSLDGTSHQDYVVTVINNPTASAVVPHDTVIDVSWNPIANATGYEVWYFAGNEPTSSVRSGGTITGTETTISNLVNNTTYYVWIKAVYAGGVTSGLGRESAPALVEKKYFGWLFGGDNTGMSSYPLSTNDGTVGAGTNVFNHPSGGGVIELEIDEANNLLFFGYKRDDNSNPPYMVNSARIDPATGALTINQEQTLTWVGLEDLRLSPDGKHLYASCGYITGGLLYCWDVNQTTGELSNRRDFSGLHEISWAKEMAVHPTKNLLYIVDYTYAPYGPAICVYDIDPSTGALGYRTSLPVGDYPFDVVVSRNSNRLIVSYQEDGISSYALDSDGLPTGSPRTNGLTTPGTGSWNTVLTAPVKGSLTADHVFALDYTATGYLRGLSDDETFGYIEQEYVAGAGAFDAGMVTFRFGETYLYTANRNAATIASFKLGETAGSLSDMTTRTTVDEYSNPIATRAVRGLNTYW